MVKRSVSPQLAFGAYAPQMMKTWGKLFGLSSAEDPTDQNPELLAELQGTSQDPQDFSQVAGIPQFQDVRQNQVREPTPDEYLDNLRAISQLPLSISDSDELRQDALENLDRYKKDQEQESLPAPREAPMQSMRAQLDPNDVMAKLANLPMSLRDSDVEREDVLSNMQQQAQDRKDRLERGEIAEVEVEGLPRTQQGQLLDPLEHIRRQLAQNPELINELPEETKAKLGDTIPNPEKAFVPPSKEAEKPEIKLIPPGQEITTQDVDNFSDKSVQEGAVEQGRKDPQILSDLKRLNDLKDIPPDALDEAQEWQNALTQREETLTAKEKALLEKAETGQLTTADKFILGLAIAIPILLALRYGATAGLISAGEGLKGYSSAIQQQQKQASEKKSEAAKEKDSIEKERLKLREKSIDINQKLLNAIPDKAAREFLKNKRVAPLGDQVGISTGDERDLLWLDGKRFDSSDEGVKRAREVIKEAEDKMGTLTDANKVVNDVIDILDALPNDTGLWEAVKSNYSWITGLGGHSPFGQKLMISVQDDDGKVKKIDAFAALQQKMNNLQDFYNKQVLGGSRLTGNVVNHWSGILGDPSHIQDWFSKDLDTFKTTTLSLKDILNSREVETLVGKGFLRQPLEEAFPSSNRKVLQSEDKVVDQIRSNPEAYRSKVK